jgi:plastocyanin
MKTIMLFTMSVFLCLTGLKAQTTYTITDDGFAFSPAELTVNTGDSVKFEGSDFHPVLEVSENTWNANGTAALTGGFDFPSGNGKLKFTEAGTHYYVCTAHVASKGMKGKIIVVVATSLQDVSGTGILSVYPVPLSDVSELTVVFKNPVQKNLEVLIYDLAGKLRITSAGSTTDGNYRVDCSALPKGIFLMKLKSDDTYVYSKVIRE